MTEAKHMRWVVREIESDLGSHTCIAEVTHNSIRFVVSEYGINDEDDAYLIAAAPDMLTALTDFVTQARDYLLDPRRTLDIGQWRETIREADAAIAKTKAKCI